MGYRIDPQPRRSAAADPTIKQIDVGGNFLKYRIERLVEQFEPGKLGILQVDDNARTLGLIDARFAQRLLEPMRRFARLSSSIFLRGRPHMCATYQWTGQGKGGPGTPWGRGDNRLKRAKSP